MEPSYTLRVELENMRKDQNALMLQMETYGSMTILRTILHKNFDEACMKEKTNRGKMQKLCIRG
jgi:hypothetical protein